MPERFSKIAKVDENQRYVNNYLKKLNNNDKGYFFKFFLKNIFDPPEKQKFEEI